MAKCSLTIRPECKLTHSSFGVWKIAEPRAKHAGCTAHALHHSVPDPPASWTGMPNCRPPIPLCSGQLKSSNPSSVSTGSSPFGLGAPLPSHHHHHHHHHFLQELNHPRCCNPALHDSKVNRQTTGVKMLTGISPYPGLCRALTAFPTLTLSAGAFFHLLSNPCICITARASAFSLCTISAGRED